MIVYWILLLLTAFIAYFLGSIDTMAVASLFVFRTELRRLGKGNIWLSNFRRIYGIGGFVKLLVVELIKDLLPLLIGGWLLGIKGHGDAGRAFAGFCLVLGRCYPVFNRFRGSHASICLIMAAMLVDSSIGFAVLLTTAAVCWFGRYLSLGAIVGAVVLILAALLLINDGLIMTLSIFTGAVVLIRHVPAISRLLNGREEKLSFQEDISYKFDEKF